MTILVQEVLRGCFRTVGTDAVAVTGRREQVSSGTGVC